MKIGWKRGYRVLAVSAAALLVAGGAVAVADAAHGGKGKAKAHVAKRLVRSGVHADVSLIRADGSTDAFAVDRGKVTASSATSLTLARADGKSVTFSVTSTTVARRIVTVGRPAIVFSRNGAAFRIIAAGPVTMAPVVPALAGKSPVVHLDAKVPHGRLEFGTPKQQLHSTQVLCAPIDQCCLGSPHRVRAVLARVKAKLFDPAFEDSGVLTRPQMW